MLTIDQSDEHFTSRLRIFKAARTQQPLLGPRLETLSDLLDIEADNILKSLDFASTI